MVLPRFSGDSYPESWIFRAELYFTYLGFSKKDWLPLLSFYLEGDALAWFDWLFRNNQFYDWNHFKEKFLLHFQKQSFTDLLCISNFYELESASKPSNKTKQEFATMPLRNVMDDNPSVVAANSKFDPPSSLGSITNLQIPDMHDPISSLTDGEKCAPAEDKVFDEISQHDEPDLPCHCTSLPSAMKPALEDIKSEEVFDEMLNSCCPTSFAKAQSDDPVKMIDEDATCRETIEVQLFTESTQRDMLVREPETIEDLYLDNSFKANEDSIPASYMPLDELLSDVEHGESTRGFNDHYILNRFPFDPGANFLCATITLTAVNFCEGSRT